MKMLKKLWPRTPIMSPPHWQCSAVFSLARCKKSSGRNVKSDSFGELHIDNAMAGMWPDDIGTKLTIPAMNNTLNLPRNGPYPWRAKRLLYIKFQTDLIHDTNEVMDKLLGLDLICLFYSKQVRFVLIYHLISIFKSSEARLFSF